MVKHNLPVPRIACRGFTLLEVLLALMLTSLVLLVMSMSVDFHLHVTERGRVHVEEAQLARALLHRMADDLRGAVVYVAREEEESETGGITGLFAEAPDPSSLGLDMLDTGMSSDPAESTFTSGTPGLYGESDWLQVDVSRVPRLDQYDYGDQRQAAGSLPGDRPSDVKTITYYVVSPGDATTVATEDGFQHQTGLVRRELDRAVAAWADEQGLLAQKLDEEVPEAPEVVAVRFQYFDGTEWVDSWNSQEQGKLPAAVELSLALKPAGEDDSVAWPTTTDFEQLADQGEHPVYRLIVHLPAAQGTSESETSEPETTSGDAGASDASSAQGASGATSAPAGSNNSGGSGSSGGSNNSRGGGQSPQGLNDLLQSLQQ